MTMGTVTAVPFLNLRAGASKSAADVGDLRTGTRLEIVTTAGDWSQVRFLGADGKATVDAWAMSQWIQVDAVASTAVATLGVNVVLAHGYVEEALALGAGGVELMDGKLFAYQLKKKYPTKKIIYRKYFANGWHPSPEEFVDFGLEGVGPDDPGLIYVGFNEADVLGVGSGEEIRQHAIFDGKVGTIIKQKAPQAVYLGMTAPVGNPAFDKPEICQAVREWYAPLYNSGLIGIDIHSYSPTRGHIFNGTYDGNEVADWKHPTQRGWDDSIWLERRWWWLFTHCGFNTGFPGEIGIYSGETGMDEGGWGSWTARGCGQEEVEYWGRTYLDYNTRPLVINGVSHASPFRFGAVYTAPQPDPKQWATYNTQKYWARLLGVNPK